MTHFDQVANEWDSPKKVKLIGLTGNKIKENIQLKKPVKILDFGCGTGLLSQEFYDQASEILGIDTSEGMLEVFNKKFKDHDNARCENLNLEEKPLNEKFDLIISSMVFHHLNTPGETLGKLAELLNENGQIAIVDLDKEDGSFHPDNEEMGVKHFGFTKEDVQNWAEKSGLNLEHKLIHHIEKNEKEYDLFLAVFKK